MTDNPPPPVEPKRAHTPEASFSAFVRYPGGCFETGHAMTTEFGHLLVMDLGCTAGTVIELRAEKPKSFYPWPMQAMIDGQSAGMIRAAADGLGYLLYLEIDTVDGDEIYLAMQRRPIKTGGRGFNRKVAPNLDK